MVEINIATEWKSDIIAGFNFLQVYTNYFSSFFAISLWENFKDKVRSLYPDIQNTTKTMIWMNKAATLLCKYIQLDLIQAILLNMKWQDTWDIWILSIIEGSRPATILIDNTTPCLCEYSWIPVIMWPSMKSSRWIRLIVAHLGIVGYMPLSLVYYWSVCLFVGLILKMYSGGKSKTPWHLSERSFQGFNTLFLGYKTSRFRVQETHPAEYFTSQF